MKLRYTPAAVEDLQLPALRAGSDDEGHQLLAVSGVVFFIVRGRMKRRAEPPVELLSIDELVPLRDDVSENVSPARLRWLELCDHHFSELRKTVKRQMAARPNTWGVGLWPDEETEKIARKRADRLGTVPAIDYSPSQLRDEAKFVLKDFGVKLIPYEELVAEWCGKVVAVCDSAADEDDWDVDAYGWRLSNVRPLENRIPCKGNLKLWTMDMALSKRVFAEI